MINKSNDKKETAIAQFVAKSKSGIPVTKHRNFCTVYRMEFEDSNGDGYNSGFTANLESTFQCNANSAMFGTTADNNSNGEIILKRNDLNANAVATTKKQRPSILKGNRRENFKSSGIFQR